MEYESLHLQSLHKALTVATVVHRCGSVLGLKSLVWLPNEAGEQTVEGARFVMWLAGLPLALLS